MRIGSVFSGVGGLDLAALELFPGSSLAWHAESDPAASRVLAHHWPLVPNLGDVTAVDWRAVETVDVVVGGYPCQPFSSAGHKKGTDDERHLWPYVREAIRELRPRYILLENVAGHRILGFGRVLADMAADGLHAAWCSVRASDIGAAHRRERVFILAYPADAEVLGPQGRDGISRRSTTRGGGQRESARGHGRAAVGGLALGGDWGRYETAVRRQERESRPAPGPIEIGPTGKPRLSARFSEWLMWLPDGWVTQQEIGLSYSAQMRCIGNGVVPPQALAAFHSLCSMAVRRIGGEA